MDLVPASAAMRMSVESLSPTITTSSGPTPISAAAISSIRRFGLPTTVASLPVMDSNILMKGPISMS